jgi:predicted SnoaL-like aldol condensation-catalyzing enzyme
MDIEKILGSEVLSEEVKQSVTEAWEAKLAEAREDITAELREEFAGRYENDKTQIVEAMDAMLNDTIKSELNEFAEDKAKLAQDRVAYKKAVKEHAKLLDEFIMQTLKTEITELREDREAQKANFGKLENFVLEQLTKELNEFHEDKRSLVEQKVKMVTEGKKVIAEAKATFVKNAAEKVEKIIENALTGELTTLKEDIQKAKENEFGRKIFETFSAEFMTSTLAEGTQVAKLSRQVEEVNAQLDEANKVITDKEVAIMEAKRETKIAKDMTDRKATLNEMMAPLSKDQKEIMGALLESVKTEKLRDAFNKYLPNVLKEDAKVSTEKAKLTENTKVVTGDKATSQSETGTAEIINLKKLAGIN